MRRSAPAVAAVAAIVAVVGLAACSSDPAPKTAPKPTPKAATCSASALGALYGGADGVIQVGGHGTPSDLLRVDPRTGKIVARCAGATALSSVDPGPSPLVPQTYTVDQFAAAGSDATTLPVIPYPRSNAAETDTVRDWRTGHRTALPFGGYRIVSVTTHGLLLQTKASAEYDSVGGLPGVTTATDFCLLPTITASRSSCRPLPGASGDGFPAVHHDGSIGWVRLQQVPATFGSVHGFVVTDGSVVELPWRSRKVTVDDRVQPRDETTDWGRVVLFDLLSAPTAPLSWGTVTRVTAGGVQGTLHTTSAGVGTHVSFADVYGCTASADGDTLNCLKDAPDATNDLEIVTLRAGRSTVATVRIAGPRGDFLPTASRLLYWPTP